MAARRPDGPPDQPADPYLTLVGYFNTLRELGGCAASSRTRCAPAWPRSRGASGRSTPSIRTKTAAGPLALRAVRRLSRSVYREVEATSVTFFSLQTLDRGLAGTLIATYRVPAARADLPPGVGRLVLVPELREVRVQVSFSRFDAVSANLQGEYEFGRDAVQPAALTLPGGNEKWLPAAEIRGEGVFCALDAAALADWEARPAVQARAEVLLRAFATDPRGADFPGVRFYLLHSLAHLLLTAISLECGYAASAIRERIYCAPPGDGGLAGLLLSTGTTGAEGTLGGLVEEGRRLRHHLGVAWDLGRLCSNDPVCAAHDPTAPGDDRTREGAACHGCLYVGDGQGRGLTLGKAGLGSDRGIHRAAKACREGVGGRLSRVVV